MIANEKFHIIIYLPFYYLEFVNYLTEVQWLFRPHYIIDWREIVFFTYQHLKIPTSTIWKLEVIDHHVVRHVRTTGGSGTRIPYHNLLLWAACNHHCDWLETRKHLTLWLDTDYIIVSNALITQIILFSIWNLTIKWNRSHLV